MMEKDLMQMLIRTSTNGLMNMKNRAANLKGEIEIKSAYRKRNGNMLKIFLSLI